MNESAKENDVIILDRYVFSNVAFQSAKFKDAKHSLKIREWIADYQFNVLKMPYPDLTVFLDVPVEVTKKRLKQERTENRKYLNGKSDIHESDFDYQRRVRGHYITLENRYVTYFVVDAAVRRPGESENDAWHVYEPRVLFENYKKLIDEHVVNNTISPPAKILTKN